MAKSILGSDTLPKVGRVNEVCREWSVHEDGALAYRLQDEEIKDHYTGNKVRNAQVREDLPRARVEQRLEELRYQSIVQQRAEEDEHVARQIALKLEREERMRERELQDKMRLQLRLDDEAAQLEAELETERSLQEAKDQELARMLQEQEEQSVDDSDSPMNNQILLDQKLAMEAQDAELARMLQEKERAKVRRARERARQKKMERKQMQQQSSDHDDTEKIKRPESLDIHAIYDDDKSSYEYSDSQKNSAHGKIRDNDSYSTAERRKLANVAAIIDPTYGGTDNLSTPCSSRSIPSPSYSLTTPPQELMDHSVPCYMPIQGQRRAQTQSSPIVQDEKHKRKVKDGCKQQ